MPRQPPFSALALTFLRQPRFLLVLSSTSCSLRCLNLTFLPPYFSAILTFLPSSLSCRPHFSATLTVLAIFRVSAVPRKPRAARPFPLSYSKIYDNRMVHTISLALRSLHDMIT
ncbi:hypothetical protein B0J12DRAFT_688872, partial [Macrophomina phaseolina]